MTHAAEIGDYCSYDLCKQQTFTPFDCGYCNKIYCEHHRMPMDHECKHIPSNPTYIPKNKKQPKFRCKVKGCKAKCILLIKCPKCNQGFCTQHRHCDMHNCPRDVTENTINDNDTENTINDNDNEQKEEEQQMEDNRWLFVKTQLCKDWNTKIVEALQAQIIEEEFDFEDLSDDLEEFDIDDNNSGLMEYMMEKYKWENDMALNFYKNIIQALKDSPKLEMDEEPPIEILSLQSSKNGNESDDSLDDIYGYSYSPHVQDNTANIDAENQRKKKKEKEEEEKAISNLPTIIRWIYEEIKKYIPYVSHSTLMEWTNKVIPIIMSNENDDMAQHDLWQLFGGQVDLAANLRNQRKSIQAQIIDLANEQCQSKANANAK